jgi:predicted NAD/FAD-dependent oxidoreductase
MKTARPHIAVLGAGMAGLSCARHLQDADCRVTVYDKARGAGGRMSTRRGDGWQCDHGAQYFTVRDDRFGDEVARWEAAGVAGLWEPKLAVFDAGGGAVPARAAPDGKTRFVGIPRMSAPAAWLAATLCVHSGHTVVDLRHDRAGWRLHTAEHGVLDERFDAVVLALPAPQAATLLQPLLPLTAQQAGAHAMLPCWTLMVRYDADAHAHARYAPDFDAAFVNHGPLRWIARDSSKPGRPGADVWTLQASAAWSAAHLDDDSASVTAALLAAFAALGAPPPAAVTAHRWRYARAQQPALNQAVWLPAVRVGLCGDWLGGGRVEDAWLSGRALAAQAIISMVSGAAWPYNPAITASSASTSSGLTK